MNQLTKLRSQLQLIDAQFSFSSSEELDLQLDQFFGIKHELDEHAPAEFYPNTEQVALSTSYLDYFQILNTLPPGSTLVDLGAGYCRGTLLSHLLNLNPCLSIEAHKKRTNQAISALKKLGYESTYIQAQRIEKCQHSSYQYFYIYFPLNKSLLKSLNTLLHTQSEVELFITEAHGESLPFFNSLVETKLRTTFTSASKRHHADIHHYSFAKTKSSPPIVENLGSWFLHHLDEKLVIEYSYFHQLKKRKVSLFVSLEDLFPIEYQGHWCFQNIHTGRIYSQKEFDLKQSLSFDQLDPSLQQLVQDPRYKYRKILGTPSLELE
ncbi:MAG: hypothetical protein CME62_14460 [Halobacteriovoraceae bacterium]|nr:hypothetical protein [Halobacteriovoraceae bacterium]